MVLPKYSAEEVRPLRGWLTKIRKKPTPFFTTTRRWFVLLGRTLRWYECENGRALGEACVVGATVEHPSSCSFEVSFASGRRDELRVDDGAQPTAREWVLGLRTAALREVSKRRRSEQFIVRKSRGNRKAATRKIQVKHGYLSNTDLQGRLRRPWNLADLGGVERSKFVPQQLVLSFSNRKPVTLEFGNMDDAERFYGLVEAQRRTDPGALPAIKPTWLRLRVCTWNVGNRMPPPDLGAWLHREGGSVRDADLANACALDGDDDDDDESPVVDDDDLVVVGCQECTYNVGRPAKSDREDWVRVVSASFLDRGYKLHCEAHFWALRLLVFIKVEHSAFASTVEVSHRGCGIGDCMGNKGAVATALSLYDTTLAFVCAHLEASQTEVQGRNDDFCQIVDRIKLGRPDIDLLNQFDHVFFFGDLNYRVDVPENVFFAEGLDLPKLPGGANDDAHDVFIRKRELLTILRDADQLDAERAAGRAFWGFDEAQHFDFAPTYRFERPDGDSQRTTRRAYTPNRTPSWCDRILWKSLPGTPPVVQTLLTSVDDVPDLDTSDHAPVIARFAFRRFFFDDADDDDDRGDNCIAFDGDVQARPGPGLAPFHFRKPQRCALRFFGRFIDAKRTDFAQTAACLAPRWTDLAPLKIARVATLAALARSALVVQLVCDQTSQTLGTALVSLKDACRGRPAPFEAFLTYKGVTCGTIKGILVAIGPLFKPDLPSSTQPSSAACSDEDDDTDPPSFLSFRSSSGPPTPLERLSTPMSPEGMPPSPPPTPRRLRVPSPHRHRSAP